jgi:hypothetical protein
MYGLKIWNPGGELYFTSELDFACIYSKQQITTNVSTGLGYSNTLLLPTFPFRPGEGVGSTGVKLPFTLTNIPVGCVIGDFFKQLVVYSGLTYSDPVIEIATKAPADITVISACNYQTLEPYLEKDDYGLIVNNASGSVSWSSGVKLVNLIGSVGFGIIPMTDISYYISEFTIDYDLEAGEDFFFDLESAVGGYYLPEVNAGGVVLHRISSHTFRFYKYARLNISLGTPDVYGDAYALYNTSTYRAVGTGIVNADHSRKGWDLNISVFVQKL